MCTHMTFTLLLLVSFEKDIAEEHGRIPYATNEHVDEQGRTDWNPHCSARPPWLNP